MDRLTIMLVLVAYGAASTLSFILYAVDKRAAVRGGWRISERTLHLVELCGGFVGAFAAQHLLRHKRRKVGYMVIFWLIVGVHAGVWWLVLR